MKSRTLILLFMINAMNVYPTDGRWHYALGVEFNPQVPLLGDHQFAKDRICYGYSVGPGFSMDKNNFIASTSLHYKWLKQHSTYEGQKFDTTNGNIYPWYKDDYTRFDHSFDFSINVGVQFGNDKNKVSIMMGGTLSLLYRTTSVLKREYYDDPSIMTYERAFSKSEWYQQHVLRIAFHHKFSSRFSFKIEPSIGHITHWIPALNLGVYYSLHNKE